MSEVFDKASYIKKMRETYNELEVLLASLSEEQMITPNVNGPWSVKDNLAHLTAWLQYLLDNLQGISSNQQPPDWMPGLSTEDEINAFIYQQNKERPLADILADFRAMHQRVLAKVESLSEASLNAPFPWNPGGSPSYSLVMGNTIGHYEEHGSIIRDWLQKQ